MRRGMLMGSLVGMLMVTASAWGAEKLDRGLTARAVGEGGGLPFLEAAAGGSGRCGLSGGAFGGGRADGRV